jgi:hypothetical protein
VERYARFGIEEYFIFDRKRLRLSGYRLAVGGTEYAPIVPQAGRWPSAVLGLELGLERDRLRLYAGTAPVPELQELAARGESLLSDAMTRVEAAERRAEEEARRAQEEARRAQEEAERAARAEAEVERLRAELERLRASGPPSG